MKVKFANRMQLIRRRQTVIVISLFTKNRATEVEFNPAEARELAAALIEAAGEAEVALAKIPSVEVDPGDLLSGLVLAGVEAGIKKGVEIGTAATPMPGTAETGGFGRPLPESERTGSVAANSSVMDLAAEATGVPQNANELLNGVEADPDHTHRVIINGVPFIVGDVRRYIILLSAVVNAQVEKSFAGVTDAERHKIKSVPETECSGTGDKAA